jgi:hypothetical protein
MRLPATILACAAAFLPASLSPAQGQEQAQDQTQAESPDQAPVAIAPGVFEGEPEVSTRDFKGHKAWSIVWYRDPAGRALQIGFVEGMMLPYRSRPIEMLNFMHDEGSDDEPDLRQHTAGRAEPLWGLDVFWMVASERAVMEPDPDKPETTADGRLHRGESRRNCAIFTAHPAGEAATLIGSYCRELPPDVAIDEATARQWLEALNLKLRE